MKKENFKEWNDSELIEKVKEEELNYIKMTLTHAITPLESSARIKDTRKVIARLKTEIRKREINK